MATDDNVSDAVKLNAIRDALDRGGVGVKAEIELSAKPYENIADQIETMRGGSRAAHRTGVPDVQPHALPAANDNAIDAELVVDPNDDDAPIDLCDVGPLDLYGTDQSITPGDDERRSVFGTAPPNDGLMTMEDSMDEIARLRREAVQRTRQEQRALPPGRSDR
ncbi:hypothetical protein [Mycobacterium angelicum]|uniref:Uncharacterized protein n=1 Tax=Mycobacterium angelicum TaxID=470074 RepID=A0A1W9ZTA6_MYCAN|nr:hypothetical protein [Mycobacterium angelicum]MCV7196898.1 hypothetical protein [Mycobacterium angelicum]ORA20766.1 hypothetical protein BST12_14260 [Mycobacterium angelicum]